MPDTLDSNGLTVQSLPELTGNLTTSLQLIYGSDINVDQNSPDAQMINIYSQVSIDQREVLLDIYNMFFVENAYGVNLDNLVALNGVTRTGATFTTTPVSITVNQALTLVGGVFTVTDTAGYNWQLQTTYAFSGAATTALTFVCTTPGAVTPAANTITQQATAQLGVTGVNNPTIAGTSIGVDEQSDASLKIVRAKSFKLAATGPAAAITAALFAAGASDAVTYENNTASMVGVIPANSIYVVVNSSLYDNQIATTIEKKKMPGCGMYGSKSAYAPIGSNVFATMKWDIAVALPLYVKATLLAKKTGETFDTTAVAAAIAAIVYTLNEVASIGDIISAIIAYNSDIIPTVVGVCATWNGTFVDQLPPTALKNFWTISTGVDGSAHPFIVLS